MRLSEAFRIHSLRKFKEASKKQVSFKLSLPFDQYWNPKKTKEGVHGIDNTQGTESESDKQADERDQDQGLNQRSAKTADESGQAKADKIILENPAISAPTLLNTLKAKGVKLVDTIVDSNEADSGSANAQVLRSNKESKGNINSIHEVKFMEADNPKDGVVGFTKFRCVIIKEGMGNLRDAFYYSRQALEGAVTEFEGKKIFADHPSETDEMVRPERSVRDVLGHFENVSFVENEDGQGQLEADVVVLPQESFRWARGLLTHAVEYSKKYPDKEFIGLSINASGEADAQPIDQVIESAPEVSKLKLMKARDEMGITEVRVVSKISEAVSCDLVTEAGAGGKILNLIEQEKAIMKKKVKESEKDQKPVVDQKPPPEAMPEAAAVDGEKHDDEAQDIELIKKMISKYLGDDKGIEESGAHAEATKIAHECYTKAKEKGMDHDTAMKCAEVAVEVAKGRSMESEESEESEEAKESEESHKESEETKESEEKKEDEAKECKESDDKDADDKKKESEVKEAAQVVALTGKVAFLETELKKFRLEKHLEELCEKAGLPMLATKKFKALEAVKTARSEKELGTLMNVFKESWTLGGGEAAGVYDFVIQTEKTTFKEGNGAKISFEDCLK